MVTTTRNPTPVIRAVISGATRAPINRSGVVVVVLLVDQHRPVLADPRRDVRLQPTHAEL
ncbi:hypothetical protein [Micromonospora sp. WMMD737]|uniref:hypothetical protein n=1 Tax=Micromonospora sp. WMMD737 TaxID=3404113 RepID=UPI003B953EA5